MTKSERRRLARQRASAKATRRALLGEEIAAERDRSYQPVKRVQRDDRPDVSRIPGAAARNWISVPPRTRGTIADAWQPPTRLTFSEGVIARHDPTYQRTQMVESQSMRQASGRNFTGKPSETPDADTRKAQAMRDQLAVSWDAHHATMVSGSAAREGRAQYRPERTELRSTTKLGDFASD